jgi:pyruvate/2-oxoacid:ferredoxin oxidoreductase beta subunit
VLYEINNGTFQLTAASKSIAQKGGNLRKLDDFIAEQERFKNITEKQFQELQKYVNLRWERYLKRAGF